jgi:hypothetical protein
MTACPSELDHGPRSRATIASFLACLLLTTCAQPAQTDRWVKSGADDATTAHELQACRDQAAQVLANQQGINADITATLGGNWQRSSTYGLMTQSLDRSAQGAADRAVENCMRAKGFAKSA